jgi:Mn-dependent DtxR family transcriptional regulator
MIAALEREVLIDVLHNRGASRDQVRYRLAGYSPLSVNRAIEQMISRGFLEYYEHAGKLELTRAGLMQLSPQVVMVI